MDVGHYVDLLDWGNACWGSREQECPLMEEAALEMALKRWRDKLDLSLLWKIRTGMALEIAQYGRLPYTKVREGLHTWLSLRKPIR
jgi:hypothetical protein